MATIEHRRVVPRYPGTIGARAADDADDDGVDDAPRGPGKALDRLSWLGWLSAGVAVGWLILQLRPLLDGGAFAEPRRLEDVVRVVRGVAGAAALALPAAVELGVSRGTAPGSVAVPRRVAPRRLGGREHRPPAGE